MASTLLKGDQLLNFKSGKNASFKDFNHGRNVIIIHGFTSSAEYLTQLSSDISDNNYNVFQFNYNSYRGIGKAASSLLEILDELDDISKGAIQQMRVSLICHSMGGLVGRALVQLCNGKKYVNALVTLGSPHDGTLKSSELVDVLIRWGEYVSTVMPHFTPDCDSAKELTGKDQLSIINAMNNDTSKLLGIKVLSISGGKPNLKFKSKVFEYIANNKIQKIFAGTKNDGLVCENSSDCTNNLTGTSCDAEHFNNYVDYDNLNHSFITNNHRISLKICSWLNKL